MPSVSLALTCLPHLTSVEVKETPVQCVGVLSTCHLQPHCCALESERKRQEGEGIYSPVPLPYFVFPRVFVLCLCISSFPTPSSSGRWAGCAFILEQYLQQSRCPGKCPVRSGSLPFVPNEILSAAFESLEGHGFHGPVCQGFDVEEGVWKGVCQNRAGFPGTESWELWVATGTTCCLCLPTSELRNAGKWPPTPHLP